MRQTIANSKQLTASAVILTETNPVKVLLIRHKKHGCWIQPGGHVEIDENPLECIKREVLEETGIEISPWLADPQLIDKNSSALPIPDFTAEYLIPPYGDEPQHYHVDWLYVVRIPQAIKTQVEESAADDIGWFTLDQAIKLKMFDNTKHFLRQFMR